MLIKPQFIIDEMIVRHMSQDRLSELLGIRKISLQRILRGEARLNRDIMKDIFPNLSKQIEEHRFMLPCPLCGFSAIARSNKNTKSVQCTQCQCFVRGKTLVEAISKWNERFEKVVLKNGIANCALCGSKPFNDDSNSISCPKCGFMVTARAGRNILWEVILKIWNRRYKNKIMEAA